MTDRRTFFEGFADLMYRQRDVRAAFDAYVAEGYVQHNPSLADGPAAARDALAEKFAKPGFTIDVVRLLVDGDVCALHLRPCHDGVPAGHPQGYQDCFDAFVADTYRSIAAGSPAGVDGLPTFADGARAAVVTDAVLRSATTRRWEEIEPVRARTERPA